MTKIECIECMNELALEAGREYEVGDIIECPHCGSELEVSAVSENSVDVILVEEEK